jgi:hypothetical protein
VTTLAAKTRALVRAAIVSYLESKSAIATPAEATAEHAPALPVTVVTGVNDTFRFTGGGGLGAPETFTIQAGTFSTMAQLENAIATSVGTSAEQFSTRCEVTDDGTDILLIMEGEAGAADNGNTISEGNGAAALIGFSSTTAFAGGLSGDGTIPYLNGVFGFPLKFTPEPAFYDPDVASRTDGALIWLYWPDQDDHRIEFGGDPGGYMGGTKQVTIHVNMDCIFKSSSPDTQIVGENNEAFLDGLVNAIRADRKAGSPDVIYQWGEGDRTPGDHDIKVSSDYPVPIANRQNLAVVYSKVVVTTVVILETT